MARRIISIFAVLVLVAAVMAGTGANLSAKTPDCCAGAMCPMHRSAVDCDMSHPAATLRSCPDQSSHYTASLTFIPIAPLAHLAAHMIAAADIFVPASAPHVIPGVDSPPPRFVLA